jgi:hypothetical protein
MVLAVPQIVKSSWGIMATAGLSLLALACGSAETTDPQAALGDGGSSPAPTIQSSGIMASQNSFGGFNRRSPFVPLDDPEFLTAEDASFLGDDNLVMGLYIEGQSRAYPIGMVYYHHVVNDTVDGRPMLITY